MNRKGVRPLFITIEGIDGAGKSTQVEALYHRLVAQGRDVIKTREPGGTPVGDAIRKLLLDPQLEMSAFTEMYLYAASRAEHVKQVIIPALTRGATVVCDRFVDASISYQGFGLQAEGLSPELVKMINEPAVASTIPDLTVVIDIDPQLAEERMQTRNQEQKQAKDRIERRGMEFYARVRQGLRSLYESEPSRFLWLDGHLSIDVLTERIWQAVNQL